MRIEPVPLFVYLVYIRVGEIGLRMLLQELDHLEEGILRQLVAPLQDPHELSLGQREGCVQHPRRARISLRVRDLYTLVKALVAVEDLPRALLGGPATDAQLPTGIDLAQ